MPDVDGLEATRQIVQTASATRILILTTFDLDEYVYEGLRAGASGFLVKDSSPVQLIAAIHLVVLGLLAQGRSNSEIAHDLVVSQATAKTHVRNVSSDPCRHGGPDPAQANLSAARRFRRSKIALWRSISSAACSRLPPRRIAPRITVIMRPRTRRGGGTS